MASQKLMWGNVCFFFFWGGGDGEAGKNLMDPHFELSNNLRFSAGCGFSTCFFPFGANNKKSVRVFVFTCSFPAKGVFLVKSTNYYPILVVSMFK